MALNYAAKHLKQAVRKHGRDEPNDELSLSRALSIAVLAVVLVSAQIAGVAHRIRHAPGLGSGGQSAQWPALAQQAVQLDQDSKPSTSHDCAAYEAATLSNCPPSAKPAQTAASPKHLPQATFFSAARCVTALNFHSRAPHANDPARIDAVRASAPAVSRSPRTSHGGWDMNHLALKECARAAVDAAP